MEGGRGDQDEMIVKSIKELGAAVGSQPLSPLITFHASLSHAGGIRWTSRKTTDVFIVSCRVVGLLVVVTWRCVVRPADYSATTFSHASYHSLTLPRAVDHPQS